MISRHPRGRGTAAKSSFTAVQQIQQSSALVGVSAG
jgi:hypothetical protein